MASLKLSEGLTLVDFNSVYYLSTNCLPYELDVQTGADVLNITGSLDGYGLIGLDLLAFH